MTPKPNPKVAEPSASAGYAEAAEQAAQTYDNPEVADSFAEFDGIDEAAKRMEMVVPGKQVKQTAKRILTALAQEFPRYYMVSPDEDGEVAIETIGELGRVLIVCDEEGVACFTIVKKQDGYKRYDHEEAKHLPNDFIRSAVKGIK